MPALAPQLLQVAPSALIDDKSTRIATIPTPKWTLPSSSGEVWPTNLIKIIQAITTTTTRQPTPPMFTFDLTSEAAKKNYMILMHTYKGNLVKSLESQQESIVGYGSEFRDKNTLFHSSHATPTGLG